MAKVDKAKTKKRKGSDTSKPAPKTHSESATLLGSGAVDASLASLFTNSAGPVQRPAKVASQPRQVRPQAQADALSASNSQEDLSDPESLDVEENSDTSADATAKETARQISEDKPKQKRKRKRDEGTLEDDYMSQLAKDDDGTKRRKHKKVDEGDKLSNGMENGMDEKDIAKTGSDSEASENQVSPQPAEHDVTIPQHEALVPPQDDKEFEKSVRTVFLSNVSTTAITSRTAKKALTKHLSSFLTELGGDAEAKSPHKVESLRFRSTAFASLGLPKKAAFARKELMDATTKSSNAYVVYSTIVAAREAVRKLNGTVVLERHLRVDSVAHPAKIDHTRCVFVGNVGFVDDESQMDANGDNDDKPKKKKPPGDAEEGLWRQFGKAGTVESVRVIRDPKTRVGKGVAYVQFTDGNAVEAALLFNDHKFPPLLPRKLRVTRARKFKKTALSLKRSQQASLAKADNPNAIYNPKATPKDQSQKGRASRLLGRAGAAQLQHKGRESTRSTYPGAGVTRTPEAVVFEGYRASSQGGKAGLGKKKGKKQGKPVNRSSKRGAAWKASGGRKSSKE